MTRYRARISVVMVALLSWIDRWSVSSFCTNVELVAHSSTSKPPNIHVLSPSAVAVRSRASAPFFTAPAPAADCTDDGLMMDGFTASSRFVLTVSQPTSAAAATIATQEAPARPYLI